MDPDLHEGSIDPLGSAEDVSDEQLISAAAEVLKANFDPVRHCVGAALLAASGRVYAAVHLGSARINVCAEEVALGVATSAGERRFKAIVAVAYDDQGQIRVVSPCGLCREVLWFYGRDIQVIAVLDGAIHKAPVHELLPGSWLDSAPWDVQSKQAAALDPPNRPLARDDRSP